MKKTPERKLDVLIQEGLQLLEPTEGTAMDYDCVVLTQMLGRDYEYKWLAEWRKQNPNLLVINDRVQGGPLTQEDTSCSDVTLYSVGQDKIPNTMGGGFGVIHHDQELWNYMVEQMETLPFESAWERLVFVLKKIPTYAIYNWRWAAKVVEFFAMLAGLSRNGITDSYRKGNPGFMHGEYMIRPSPALIESFQALQIEHPFAKWEELQTECQAKITQFWSHIPEELHEKVAVTGAKTSCSYFFVRVPDTKQSRQIMADEGCLTIMNQTYLAADATSAQLVHNMITLPTLVPMTDEEVGRTAAAIVKCWNEVEEDVVTIEEFEARAAEAKKAGAHGTGL